MKRCIECGVLKEETSEFFQFRKDTQKFKNMCRECHNKYNRGKYKEYNPEGETRRQVRDRLLKSGFIRCVDCGGIMSLDKFNNHPNGFGGKKTHCKSCQSIRKKNIKNNPKAVESQNKRRRLKRYGLAEQDFDDIMAKQNNRCKICFSDISWKTVAIDHCHSKGHVRGLLCGTCNSGLGFFKDNIDNLKNAIVYLSVDGSDILIGDKSE